MFVKKYIPIYKAGGGGDKQQAAAATADTTTTENVLCIQYTLEDRTKCLLNAI